MNRHELEMARKFGHAGRLYPHLHKQVRTPRGTGTLEQVFEQQCLVTLDRLEPRAMYKDGKVGRVMTRFHPSEVEAAS